MDLDFYLLPAWLRRLVCYPSPTYFLVTEFSNVIEMGLPNTDSVCSFHAGRRTGQMISVYFPEGNAKDVVEKVTSWDRNIEEVRKIEIWSSLAQNGSGLLHISFVIRKLSCITGANGSEPSWIPFSYIPLPAMNARAAVLCARQDVTYCSATTKILHRALISLFPGRCVILLYFLPTFEGLLPRLLNPSIIPGMAVHVGSKVSVLTLKKCPKILDAWKRCWITVFHIWLLKKIQMVVPLSSIFHCLSCYLKVGHLT